VHSCLKAKQLRVNRHIRCGGCAEPVASPRFSAGGVLHILDGKTGKPRTIIDIEKAARIRTVETGNAPRFRNVPCAGSPYSPKTEAEAGETAPGSTEAA
jgi:hypothetical protein